MPFPTVLGESLVVTLQFALLLRDGFTGSDQLLGDVKVKSGTFAGRQKDSSGAFLFFDLPPGPQSFLVSSGVNTPYYQPITIAVTVPMPSLLWPAFPDRTLADTSLPLDDPGQPAAYIAQRQLATLLPRTAYPFPSGTTLIRGAVLHGGLPLSAATVQAAGTDPAYVTGADGEFVLFVSSPSGVPQVVAVTAKHAGLADGSSSVTVMRGLSVSTVINM
jgi:hypothetical protein